LKVEITIFDINKKIQIYSSIEGLKTDLSFKEINVDLSLEKSTIQQSKTPKKNVPSIKNTNTPNYQSKHHQFN
jgi:hypothetical protein